ncbi:hypothetical protein Ancab_001230 [Ancistrocladus abbreviatus]
MVRGRTARESLFGLRHSPWKGKGKRPSRLVGVSYPRHYFSERFDHVIDENVGLDPGTKLCAIRVSPAVVSLVSSSEQIIAETMACWKKQRKKSRRGARCQLFPFEIGVFVEGRDKVFVCTGTIIESEESNGIFISTILTSASLLGSSSDDPSLAPDLEVKVFLSDGRSFAGEVSAFDFHYNIAIVKIMSDDKLPIAVLRPFDDSISITPDSAGDMSSIKSCCHDCFFRVNPGDKVIAVGRHNPSLELMAAAGTFSVGDCNLDCEELCVASCKISISIYVHFYRTRVMGQTNVRVTSGFVCDCKLLLYDGRVHHPWTGARVTSLCAASINELDNIIQMSPRISKGVIVDKVMIGSPAYTAGIRPNDIILQLGLEIIGSPTKFFEIILDKCGAHIKMVVKRANEGGCLTLTMIADETRPNGCYRWPIPRATMVSRTPRLRT